ncbi:MAG: phospholipase D-like domain-containing protein [Candidatus Omnitrophica bacterium]|nr:phospholipase D-like domain-containing protein [Candidatus Omnitrophota bacterium]
MNKLYTEIIIDCPVEKFLRRRFIIDEIPQSLIIVSPIICTLKRTRYTIPYLVEKITKERIRTYVITRKPEENFHKEAVDILAQSDFIEIRYNNSLHANLYICAYLNEWNSFALLGSANLTKHSIEKNIEVGVIIYSRNEGKNLRYELYRGGELKD